MEANCSGNQIGHVVVPFFFSLFLLLKFVPKVFFLLHVPKELSPLPPSFVFESANGFFSLIYSLCHDRVCCKAFINLIVLHSMFTE